MSSTRLVTELQIWNTGHEVKIPIRYLSVSSALRHHVSCIVAIPSPSVSENRMCPSFFWGSSIMSKPTLFVTILNSCGLNQSSSPFSKWNRQRTRSRLFYSTLYCLNALIFSFSLFLLPLFLLALQWCQILGSFALNTTLFSPPDKCQLVSRSVGLNSWPEFRAVNFLNKVSFNET